MLCSTIQQAWQQIRGDLLQRARSHLTYADTVGNQVEPALSKIRKQLSSEKQQLEEKVEMELKNLRAAIDAAAKAKLKAEVTQRTVRVRVSVHHCK